MRKMRSISKALGAVLIMVMLLTMMAMPVAAATATEPTADPAAATQEAAGTETATTEEAATTGETAATEEAAATEEVAATEEAVPAETTETVEEALPEAPVVDLNGTYQAAMGIQTCNTLWIGRYAYFDANINEQFGTDQYSTLFSGAEKTNNYAEYTGTFQDITIEGNGTYTVTLTGADFAEETTISQLHVATNIPVNDQIKFTDVKVKALGKTQVTFDEAYMETDKKFESGGMVFLVMNHWRAPLEKFLEENGQYIDGSGLVWLRGAGDDSIEITFTVSGFAYDKVEEAPAEVTEAPAPADTDAANEAAEATTANTSEKEAKVPLLWIILVPAVLIVAVVLIIVVVSKKKK